MLFFSGVVDPIVKKCPCGRCFTANDWLDLIPLGFMDGGDDYTLLDLRNCPCGSTICTEVMIGANPAIGLGPHLGQQAMETAKREAEKAAFLRWLDALLSEPEADPTKISTLPAPDMS